VAKFQSNTQGGNKKIPKSPAFQKINHSKSPFSASCELVRLWRIYSQADKVGWWTKHRPRRTNYVWSTGLCRVHPTGRNKTVLIRVNLCLKKAALICVICGSFFNQKRRGLTKKPQNRKKFSNPLTLYSIITYPFSVFSFFLCGECFFDQNAHLRPIMWILYIPILSEIKFNENKNLSATPFGGNP